MTAGFVFAALAALAFLFALVTHLAHLDDVSYDLLLGGLFGLAVAVADHADRRSS